MSLARLLLLAPLPLLAACKPQCADNEVANKHGYDCTPFGEASTSSDASTSDASTSSSESSSTGDDPSSSTTSSPPCDDDPACGPDESVASCPAQCSECGDGMVTGDELCDNGPDNKTYWPGEPAVGRVIHSGGFDRPGIEIVGVARDHKVRSAGEDAMPYVHRPIGPGRSIDLVVRTAGPAAPLLPVLRKAIWALEPDAVFTTDGAATEAVDATMAPTRIGAALIGVVGVLALLLAAVGLYGVIAYSVSLRTREVGIRLALGAERGQVLRMVLGQGARLALVGVGLGAVLAAGAAGILQSMLYGVSAFDPLAYGAAAAALLVVALAANLVPAVAASRVAPATAIRV